MKRAKQEELGLQAKREVAKRGQLEHGVRPKASGQVGMIRDSSGDRRQAAKDMKNEVELYDLRTEEQKD